MRYIAVDLHKTSIVACYLENEKFRHRSYKIEEVEKFKQSLQADDELAFEVTANSSWFYRQCENLVSRIVVVNTSEFGVIASSAKKTDKNDAKTLVRYLAKNMLPEVRVKTQEQQELETLFNARKLLTKQSTMIKNEIHGILLVQGMAIKSSELDSVVGLERINSLCTESAIKFTIVAMVESLKNLTSKIKEFDHQLEELGSKLAGYENLKSIYGLGTNTIVLLLATIGHINNFANAGKLSSYLGVIPIVRNSNQSVKHGCITKRGNSFLRGNLTMCALVAIGKNTILNDFYERIKVKGGHKKAIMATVHKLIKIIYYTLKYDWKFTDFCAQKRVTLAINW